MDSRELVLVDVRKSLELRDWLTDSEGAVKAFWLRRTHNTTQHCAAWACVLILIIPATLRFLAGILRWQMGSSISFLPSQDTIAPYHSSTQSISGIFYPLSLFLASPLTYDFASACISNYLFVWRLLSIHNCLLLILGAKSWVGVREEYQLLHMCDTVAPGSF